MKSEAKTTVKPKEKPKPPTKESRVGSRRSKRIMDIASSSIATDQTKSEEVVVSTTEDDVDLDTTTAKVDDANDKKPSQIGATATATANNVQETSNTNHQAIIATASTTLSTDDPKFIPKGQVRIGRLKPETGTYTNWNHLNCWRVPARVYEGLTNPTNADTIRNDLLHMDEILISGFGELAEEDKNEFIEHIMDRSHVSYFSIDSFALS